jgi:hypothetical protein
LFCTALSADEISLLRHAFILLAGETPSADTVVYAHLQVLRLLVHGHRFWCKHAYLVLDSTAAREVYYTPDHFRLEAVTSS